MGDDSNNYEGVDMDMMGSTMAPMKHMSMKMYYHFSSSEMILFKSWTISTVGGLIWSSAVIILLCFVYEAMKWVRTYFRKKEFSSRALLPNNTPRRKLTSNMLIDGLFHFIQLVFGYTLMLVIMTYNVWLCLAVVFGEVVAHLLFRFLLPDLDKFGTGSSEGTCCEC